MYNLFFKQVFDRLLALLGLFMLLPLLLLLYIVIFLVLGQPVFFTQKRPGFHGKPFFIVKFRTMRDVLDENGTLLPDELRMTRLGSFLRKSSLDELPGLWNVLAGNMSLVGPRPLLMEYLPLYTERQQKRHDVKPGITGWAQVNGRNAISWEEKFKLDVWYVENQSFLLDIKILFLTIYKVLKRSDISQQEHVTMGKFTGSEND